MTELCLFEASTVLGDVSTGCIQDYMLYGIVVFLAGLLIASFIPSAMGKKIGLGMVILGLIRSYFGYCISFDQ